MHLTSHAQHRMVERIGITKKACYRLAEKALNDGWSIDEVCSDTRDWMQYQLNYETGSGQASNMRLYGNNLYLFTQDNVLVTVLIMPSKRFRVMTRSASKRNQFFSGKPKDREDFALENFN